ncbi:MAG TPA: hypothetical protein VGW31_04410 [Hanamia sp.]|nr:hypothetical protein [Hanamia sp.]
MKKLMAFALLAASLFYGQKSYAQIDLNHVDIQDIIGKVMHVEKGFAPKFSLGKTPIDQISKVAEILGLKKNEEVNRLFKTFKTGRIVYKVAAYTGSAIVVYGLVRKLDNSLKSQDYNAALYSGIGAIGSGLVVKFLTKGASYKAVDIFNGIAVKTIKDIFSIAPASNTAGIGLYVKL